MIEIGLKHTSELTVTEDVTAITVGSGDMPVLATPMMMEYLKPYNVALEAWSPLAEGRHGFFKNPVLMGIGEQYGKTSAQVALKFLIQNGIIIIPKTTHKERMRMKYEQINHLAV